MSGGVSIGDQHHLSVRMEGDVGGNLIGNCGIVFGEGAGLNFGEGSGSSISIRARVGGGASLCRERLVKLTNKLSPNYYSRIHW